MSTSEPETTSQPVTEISLQVEAPDPETEIFVIDGKFRLQTRGVGRLNAHLQPGIYKVKCRTGAVTDEQLVVLRDEAKVIKLARLSFSSPVPLNETTKTHEYHMEAAAKESTKVHVTAGAGSWIFVFARDWTTSDKTPISWNPAMGLSLEDEFGNTIVDLASASVANLSRDPCAACNIQLNPGQYRLKLNLPSVNGETQGSLEQAVVASPGWQTQIFLLQRPYGTQPADRRADLAGAAILLASQGFDPARAEFRRIELARLGLANRRQVASDEIRQMLRMKVENPMLGILAAHLLLLDSEIDEGLVQTVVTNLRGLLAAPHPDVEALALHFEHSGTYRFQSPPMLRKSWSLIVDATADRLDLIVPGSLASQIWDRLWGTDSWLLWVAPEQTIPAIGTATSNVFDSSQVSGVEATVMAQIARQSKTIAKPTRSPFPAVTKMQFTDTRTSSVAGVAARSIEESSIPEQVPASRPSSLDDAHVKALVRRLGIPQANLKDVLANISKKMTIKTFGPEEK